MFLFRVVQGVGWCFSYAKQHERPMCLCVSTYNHEWSQENRLMTLPSSPKLWCFLRCCRPSSWCTFCLPLSDFDDRSSQKLVYTTAADISFHHMLLLHHYGITRPMVFTRVHLITTNTNLVVPEATSTSNVRPLVNNSCCLPGVFTDYSMLL